MAKRYLLGPIILATALWISCGGGTGPSQSSAAGSSGLAAGQLAVSPSTINFSSVPVGQSTVQTGTLTAGGSSIRVSSAAWNGQGYSVSEITFPATVPANQSISFTVTFAPQTAGTSSGSITFLSNASNSPNTETLTGTGAQAGQHSVSLSWNPSPSRVVGYNVYRGTRFGGPYTKLNRSPLPGTDYTDSSVQSGMTYYYVATSVGSHSVESAQSRQTTVVIPTP